MKTTFITLFSLLLFINTLNGQSFGLDVSAIDIKPHLMVGGNEKIAIGIEGEIGMNLSNYMLVAGAHFAEDRTLIKYNGKDSYDEEFYLGMFGWGVFARLFNDSNFPIDVGYRGELFLHSDDSSNNLGGGIFNGIFVNVFTPTKFKYKDERKKRKMSVGLRLTPGIFKESNRVEAGVLGDLWIRFNFGYR